MALFRRLRRPAREADGTSTALQAVALGISPALLSAAAGLAPPSATRRDRVADAGQDILHGVLAEKVLHGWLQNRHQTLYVDFCLMGTLKIFYFFQLNRSFEFGKTLFINLLLL